MKLSEAIEKGINKYWDSAHVRKNPASAQQWFIMLISRDSKQFMLVDETDNPILTDDLNELSQTLKGIGLKEFTIFP